MPREKQRTHYVMLEYEISGGVLPYNYIITVATHTYVGILKPLLSQFLI